MPLISIPTGLRIRAANWQQPPLMIRQRSAWTGRTREVALGPAQRWTCTMETPQMYAADLAAARGWLAALSAAGAYTHLTAVEAAQSPSGAPAHFSAAPGAGATSGTVLTAALSQTLAPAGGLLTLPLADGDVALVVLTEPLAIDAGGVGTARWAQPLRSAAQGAVHHQWPYARMRLATALGWGVSPGAIYSLPALQFEEAF